MHELTRLAAALSVALALATPAALSAERPFDDPIKGAAHGAAFGADGKEIRVTAAFIAHAQAAYTGRALEGASAVQRARFEYKRTYLDDLARGAVQPGDRQAALFGRSLLLDWLIDEVAPPDAALLRQRNRLLVAFLRRGFGHPDGQPYSMQPHEQAQFQQAGVLAAAAAAGPTPQVLQARETYAKKCRKAGVPIPPTWGKTGAGFWNSKGQLASVFISTDKKAEVFEYQSAAPEGVCLALPRYKAAPPDAPIELLGIICMGTGIDNGSGATVSNACFWDNQLEKLGVMVPRTGEFPINTNFAAGDELKGGSGGVCTACHAGENAYIIHPDDAAFRGIANLKPKAWYKPMVPAGWPLNPGPNTKLATVPVPAGEDSCLVCHSAGRKQRLPEIVREIATPMGENYCDAVLKNAINKTMPPGGGVLPDPDYQTHNIVLVEMCDLAAR